MSQVFKRTKEDFVCEKCSVFVKGNGYTNHCPQCLWSKHVDIHPGDRAANCGGLMKPSLKEVKGNKYVLKHTCMICKHEKSNKANSKDDYQKIVELSLHI